MQAGYQAPSNTRMKCWLIFCYFPILGGVIGCAIPKEIPLYFSLACFVILLINNIMLTVLYTKRNFCVNATHKGQIGISILTLALGLGQPLYFIIGYSTSGSRGIAGLLYFIFLICLPILILQSIIVCIHHCASREINMRMIAFYHQRNPSQDYRRLENPGHHNN